MYHNYKCTLHTHSFADKRSASYLLYLTLCISPPNCISLSFSHLVYLMNVFRCLLLMSKKIKLLIMTSHRNAIRNHLIMTLWPHKLKKIQVSLIADNPPIDNLYVIVYIKTCRLHFCVIWPPHPLLWHILHHPLWLELSGVRLFGTSALQGSSLTWSSGEVWVELWIRLWIAVFMLRQYWGNPATLRNYYDNNVVWLSTRVKSNNKTREQNAKLSYRDATQSINLSQCSSALTAIHINKLTIYILALYKLTCIMWCVTVELARARQRFCSLVRTWLVFCVSTKTVITTFLWSFNYTTCKVLNSLGPVT